MNLCPLVGCAAIDLARQRKRALLVGKALRVLEGKHEEQALVLQDAQVKAACDRTIGDRARERIGREGVGAVLFYLIAYLLMNLGAFAIVAFLRNQTGSIMLVKGESAEAREEKISDLASVADSVLPSAVLAPLTPDQQAQVGDLLLGHALGLLDVAESIVYSALRRTESRGAHQRTDFPARDDGKFLAHSLAYRNPDGSSRLEYQPVTITRWPPGERVYGKTTEGQPPPASAQRAS